MRYNHKRFYKGVEVFYMRYAGNGKHVVLLNKKAIVVDTSELSLDNCIK